MQRDEQLVNYAFSLLESQGIEVVSTIDLWEGQEELDLLQPEYQPWLSQYLTESLTEASQFVRDRVLKKFPLYWWVPSLSPEIDVQVDRHRVKFVTSKAGDVNYISPAYILDSDRNATSQYWYKDLPVGVYIGQPDINEFDYNAFQQDMFKAVDKAIRTAVYLQTFQGHPSPGGF